MKKKVLIIVIFVIIILLGCFFVFKDKLIKTKEEPIKILKSESKTIPIMNDFDSLRIDIYNKASDNKEEALCDSNEACSKLYSYDSNDYELKVIPKDDFMQINLVLKKDGKYGNIHLTGDDCVNYKDIYCLEDILKYNFRID